MKIEISGVAPHVNGSYELPWDSFTNAELHEIKRISGVLPAEMLHATLAGDAAFACALAILATRRINVRLPEAVIMNASASAIKLVFPELEADEDDPPTIPRSKTRSTSSGRGSERSSASRANGPSPTGERT